MSAWYGIFSKMDRVALLPLQRPAQPASGRVLVRTGSAALKYWHLASLDAPTVAVAWASAFAWAARVRLPLFAAVLLALVVWAIYVFDRLLDVRSGNHELQERHFFHWRHRRVLVALAAVAALAAGWMIASRLPLAALRRDSLVGLAALAYFSGVHGPGVRTRRLAGIRSRIARLISRELLVGIIFSIGCALPILSGTSARLAHVIALLAAPVAAFAALAWLNVRAIGYWEASPARSGVPQIAFGFAALCAFAGALLAYSEPHAALLLMTSAASALALAALDRYRHRIDALTLRAAADLVLLTPVLLLVPGWR